MELLIQKIKYFNTDQELILEDITHEFKHLDRFSVARLRDLTNRYLLIEDNKQLLIDLTVKSFTEKESHQK